MNDATRKKYDWCLVCDPGEDERNACVPNKVQTYCLTDTQPVAQSLCETSPDESIQMLAPVSISLNSYGGRYVLDRNRSTMYEWLEGNEWRPVVGQAGVHDFSDGDGTSALLNYPEDHTADSFGNIFIADTQNHCIRRRTPNGIVSRVAGTNINGYFDGDGTSARFTEPRAITIDANGNLFVAEQWRVRKVCWH